MVYVEDRPVDLILGWIEVDEESECSEFSDD